MIATTLTALLLCGPSGPAQPAPGPRASADGPRLSLEPESFDFGEALPAKRLAKQFSLRNLGSGELVIEKLSSSCACTAFLLDEKNRRLAPGRTAPLRVTLTTPRRAGRVVETVRITSNDPTRAVAEIKVVATVRDQ